MERRKYIKDHVIRTCAKPCDGVGPFKCEHPFHVISYWNGVFWTTPNPKTMDLTVQEKLFDDMFYIRRQGFHVPAAQFNDPDSWDP